MKILIYGSTYLTEVSCNRIRDKFDLVGYVPSEAPFIEGDIDLPLIEDASMCEHDIKLSIQYDKKILDHHNAYNVHTGLLPYWGGRDLLYHTLREKETEQGLTFHKMTGELDYGPIISKMTYPVLPEDSVLELYERQAIIMPGFLCSSLELLQKLGPENASKCYAKKPRIFRKKKNIRKEDLDEYIETGKSMIEAYKNKHKGV
tara:strand:- start:4727 stop:5335 length:609 start_codon:yes stop_codon:yes gene_type:complete